MFKADQNPLLAKDNLLLLADVYVYNIFSSCGYNLSRPDLPI